jgi:AcrR family transcriptional regulator
VRRTGRPPLTERRRAATRLEIAREAIRLFTSKGVAATSGEDIAGAAGISVRTLWRYFPNKESCVRPLLAAGIEAAAQRLRTGPAGGSLRSALSDLAGWITEQQIEPAAGLALIRLTRTEPGLRAVWLQAHHDAEPVFAEALAERTGGRADDLRTKVQAGMINVALRVAVEEHAWQVDAPDLAALATVIQEALGAATDGLPD